MNSPIRALRVHPDDNVIVALRDLAAGEELPVSGGTYRLAEPIAAKHKFADRDLPEGAEVIMYGVMVGRTTKAVAAGQSIAVSNVTHAARTPVYRGTTREWTPPDVGRWQGKTFLGYHRSNGAVGTANHWLVVPLVFCEARNLQQMKQALLGPLGYDSGTPYEQFVRRLLEARERGESLDHIAGLESAPPKPQRMFPQVDGIKFLTHLMGCGGTDADCQTLAGLLAGYITHPNVAGATVLSLGCQKTQFEHLMREIHRRDASFSKPLFFHEQQKAKSEKQMLTDALRDTFRGVAQANELRRAPAPLSKLVLGVECGGSDGFSGISANPVIGATSDRLVALGGGVVLSEFPELCGAEQDLVDRCVSQEVALRFMGLMESYNNAAKRVGSGFDQNPSHGNIADGLITDAIKSCGAARKGGTSPVQEVLDYPEAVSKPGLALLCTPGSDVESTTAEVGAGCNVVVFSTGLGTPTGNPIAPVIKISTNSTIARNLADMIDFDTGPVISGETTIDGLAGDLLDLIVRTASGEYATCAQRLGQDDFIPWKRGPSL